MIRTARRGSAAGSRRTESSASKSTAFGPSAFNIHLQQGWRALPSLCPASALRPADRLADPPLAELGAAALHLVRHHHQVALRALAVTYVVLHEALDAEAEALKDVDRALLIGRHLRHDLLDAALQRL